MSAAPATPPAGVNTGAHPKRARRQVTQLTWKSGAGARQRRESTEQDRADIALGKGTGYSIFSYLISGMIAYGGIGWLIGHFTHIGMLFPIGMLVGLAISLGWIIYRYGIKGGGQ